MSVVKAQVAICPYIPEGIVLTIFTARVIFKLSSALVIFAVTAKYLFSKYRLQALVFKIPASYRPLPNSSKIVARPVKYRSSGNPRNCIKFVVSFLLLTAKYIVSQPGTTKRGLHRLARLAWRITQ